MSFQKRPVRLYIIMEKPAGPVWPAMEFSLEDALTRAQKYVCETGKAVEVIEVTESFCCDVTPQPPGAQHAHERQT